MAALLALLLAAAPARAMLDAESASACPPVPIAVAAFPFDDPAFAKTHAFVVFNGGYLTLREAVQELRRGGYEPEAVVNAGYFGVGETEVVSYFRSSVFGNQLPYNSRMSPRACLVYRPGAGFALQQSTDENYALFQKLPGAEIYCAGPQLLDRGEDVSLRQYCSERFEPRCRADRSDPGINFLNPYPRTGACVTAGGTLKLFSANLEARKCGVSGPALAQAMLAEGCVFGLNHDGGGSAKLYWNGRFYLGHGDDQDRPVPTWAAVVKKP